MSDPVRVAVVGVTGYAGYELARLLLRHPSIEKPTFFLREAHANVHCLTDLFPQLRGWGDAPCRPLSVEASPPAAPRLHSFRLRMRPRWSLFPRFGPRIPSYESWT